MSETLHSAARMVAPDGAIVLVFCGSVAHRQDLPGGRLALVITSTGLSGVVPRWWLR